MTAPVAYLDHNASAPLLPEARDAVVAALGPVGNPSSIHGPGRRARETLETAREAVAAAAGARAGEVVFTSGATEAIAQAIIGGVQHFSADRVIVGAGEHAAVLAAARASGAAVEILPIDADGVVDLARLSDLLTATEATGAVALVSIQAANNETGVIQPLEAIEALVGPSRHVLFVDAVQVFGKRGLDFSSRATDMMAISAHKAGGPTGVGALLVKSHCDGVSLVAGGGQERGRRGGTEAVALVAGFGAASRAFGQRYDRDRVLELAARLTEVIAGISPEAVIFSHGVARLENTVAFAVPGLASSTALMALDLGGVALSSGSACSSGKVAGSHVLAAMGVDRTVAGCALRASLGWSSTERDVEAFAAAFTDLLSRRNGRDGRAA